MCLTHTKHPTFVFLSETKMYINVIKDNLAFLNRASSFGVDYDGSTGGLAVLSWSSMLVDCILATKNFLLCKIMEPSESLKYFYFFYGEPDVED